MIVYLVRHAIAEDRKTSKKADAERPLTRDGIDRMKAAVRGLSVLGLAPDLVLTSPLRRARETAAILAAGLGKITLEHLSALAPGGDPKAVLAALRRRSELRSIALVGHQPGMSALAAFLLVGATGRAPSLLFKKGAVACLTIELGSRPRRASLEWLLQPGALRCLGSRRPDR